MKEEIIEEVIGKYVEKNTTHIKGYTKEYVDKILEEKDKEINKLNNIINELEKYLIEMSDRSWDDNGAYDEVLDELKELKGDNK